MNRYKVTIGGLSFRYNLGYYFAENSDDAKRQAWAKHQSAFKDCGFSMLSASIANGDDDE